MKTLYKNVIITDVDGKRSGEVLVEDGRITAIGENLTADTVYDGQGLTLLPGFIDTHAHLRDPGLTYKEDIESGLRAAAKGGYTTVCAMANTVPVTDSVEKIEKNYKKAGALGTDLIQVSAVTVDFGDTLVDFEAIRKLTPIFSNDGHNVDDETIMRESLERSKELGFIVATHNEPETETVKRDIEILRETGGHLHICHISKKDTLDAIVKAKEEGLDITCEVTPHHLYASSLQYRVHPPFRTNADKMALIKGAAEGKIDTCGSDHAPHSSEDKESGAPGIDNFEAAFGLYNTVFRNNNIPLGRLSAMLSYNPARLLGIPGGVIREGEPADFVLVDPEEEWQLETKDFISKSTNTPFNHDWLTGRVHRTVKDGEIIYDSGRIPC